MSESVSRREFAWRAVILLLLAASLFLLWRLAPVVLLSFGGLVLAVVVRLAADALSRVLPLPPRWAAVLVMVLAALLLAAATYFFGNEVADQLAELRRRLPEALARFGDWLEQWTGGGKALSQLGGDLGRYLSLNRLVNAASATVWLVTDLLVIAFVAMYVSFNPLLYRRGLLALVPAGSRESVGEGLTAAYRALRGWLRGQLVSMASVAVLTWLGLWLAGVPLPVALGLIAGLFEFVPVLGPFAAAVPGVLLAFTAGPMTALYAVAVYLVVQQVEGNLIMPLAQKWAVRLPPALGVVAVVALGLLFGLPGVLFATPLTVVLLALVRRLYLDRRAA